MKTWGWVSLATVLALGCAGETTTSAPTGPGRAAPARVSLSTPSVNLSPGGVHRFQATVSGISNRRVTYMVVGGDENGKISEDGTYTAPSKPGTYRVVATSAGDPSLQAQATVVVADGLNLTLSPQAPTLKTFDEVNFAATVTGAENTQVKWSAEGGTISEAGVFTANGTPGTARITATPIADPKKAVSTTVTLVPGTEVKWVSPRETLVAVPGSTVDARARVVGTSQREIVWSASGGDFGPDGRWTAPTAPGTYTLTARSKADATQSQSGTVRVATGGVTLSFVIRNRGSLVAKLDLTNAPITAAHLVSLIHRGTYDGLRVHAATDTHLTLGDPQTRTLELKDPKVGTGGLNLNVPFEATGVAPVRGVLGIALRDGDPSTGGAQITILRVTQTSLVGTHAFFANLTPASLAVLEKVEVGDVIESATVSAP